jgi:hypothetical protein
MSATDRPMRRYIVTAVETNVVQYLAEAPDADAAGTRVDLDLAKPLFSTMQTRELHDVYEIGSKS